MMPSREAVATFLFTDIEGSTRRWEHQRAAMAAALARHDALLPKSGSATRLDLACACGAGIPRLH